MRIYCLHHDKHGLHLCMGADCLIAAKALSEKYPSDEEEWGICGSWEVGEGKSIDLGKFWPFFTNNPPAYLVRDDNDRKQ
jgi:hypothetical protein